MADGNATVLRCDLDAEAVVLSRAIDDHDAALELLECLDPADYWADANRRIHLAIQAVAARGDTVDITAVTGELRVTNRLEQAGGTPYLASLAGQPWGEIEQHAKTIRDLARLRRALNTFRELAAEGANAQIPDVDAWLDSCERRAYAATTSEGRTRQTTAMYAEAGARIQAAWDEADKSAERTWGTPTGYQRLDEHTMGMRPGQLWYVGARPGQGKSAWAQQLAEYVAERGGGESAVIMASMEMSRDEVLVRAAARRSGLSSRKIQKRALEHDTDTLLQATSELRPFPILIDEEKSLTPMKLRAKIRRHHATIRSRFPKAELRLVVVDYVQLMQPDDARRNGTRAGDLGEISRALKVMAGDFDCTVLALSQLSRPEKGKTPPAPTMFEFRDSGALEADADVMIGLHRVDQYRAPREARDGVCEVHVLKGRGCGECAFQLLFDGPTTRFQNTTPESDSLWREQRE